MPIYEIINPSDPYTIDGPLKTCAVAVTYLGHGHYALRDDKGKVALPVFIFGGVGDLNDFFQETFGESFKDADASITTTELADVMNSVLIGRIRDRAEILDHINSVPEDQREVKRSFILDQRRSSMNNIGQAAWNYAVELRRVAKNVPG
jgi:hypothetical protein